MEEKQAFIEEFNGDFDLVVRPLEKAGASVCFFYLDGMVDEERLSKEAITPLSEAETLDFSDLKTFLATACVAGNVQLVTDRKEAVDAVAAGSVALLCAAGYYLLPLHKSNSRSVAEPPTTSVIKGPREGFVEDIKTNLTLVRRKLRSSRLVYEKVTVGRVSATTVVLAYVRDVTPTRIVSEIKRRLKEVEIDGVIDSSYVAKMLEERPYSLFKQVGSSEKADVVAARLLDGRAAVFVDGSPIVLTLPFLLCEDFEDSQDRYRMAATVTFSRFVRLFGIFCALVLPAAFVAVQSHQYQILPLQLMITILNATQGIPFSPTLEMVVALLLFEILSEASIRMPKHVGMALGVVGAIVLGQTAVEAGFLSSLTVLVVAMSGIGVYTVPDQAGVIGVIRMLATVAAGLLGIYGVLILFLAVFAYLNEFAVFDVPYLSPFAPIEGDELKNALFKESLTDLYKRPFFAAQKIRMKNGRKVL